MPLIQTSCLGKMGRWGNQLFEYAFARAYAEAHGCELQTPPWLGQLVFADVNDPPLDRKLIHLNADSEVALRGAFDRGQTDVDLHGFFQHHAFLDYYTREQVRRWFTVRPEIEALCAHGETTYSAVHRRFYNPKEEKSYANIEVRSYYRALERFDVPPPIFYVAAGWRPPPQALLDIEDERLANDAHYRQLAFLADFIFLRDAAVLLRANSTFSWWAATLGRGQVYSPLVGDLTGEQTVEFAEGNWPNTAGIFPNQSDLHLREK